eukprot:CAMPEP_0170344834 /NCGR_PEP_ID=MMETSP0116_2-20130129/73630_1 /TAXON_ID=400756 /ORGANISM="Durinskia baltica, Strain CSIRO CS-38" /LENGTH=30 /DNA_ID= /DNA_START= /DNA_END= /DNA_ORIENTATION=
MDLTPRNKGQRAEIKERALLLRSLRDLASL